MLKWYAQGVLCRTLDGHAHWVNTLALSTDYVLKTAMVPQPPLYSKSMLVCVDFDLFIFLIF
jgi:hypothetical protein